LILKSPSKYDVHISFKLWLFNVLYNYICSCPLTSDLYSSFKFRFPNILYTSMLNCPFKFYFQMTLSLSKGRAGNYTALQFYSFTVLQVYSCTALKVYRFTFTCLRLTSKQILEVCKPTVLLFYRFAVLHVYSFTVL
jgi:hypothetical protein